MSGNTLRKYNIHLNNVCPDETATLYPRLKGLAETHHLVDVYLNQQYLKQIDISYTLAKTVECDLPGIMQNGDNTLMLKLSGSASSIGFDWYELEFLKNLHAVDDFLTFSLSGHEEIIQYEISGFDSSEVMVFHITDPFSVMELGGVHLDSSGKTIAFVDSVGLEDERHYIALSTQKFQQPASISPVRTDLRFNLLNSGNEADYVIITHESLLGADIERLAAHRQNPLHWSHPGIPKVKVVTTFEIYDQFSHGLVDPVAIRNFLKYAFENWKRAPSYVLLVGDATFDFKDNFGLGLPLLVPSYESGYKVSDDWFVNLTNDRKMDMLVGRLPVKSTEKLAVVVDKIIHYDTSPPPGRWRSVITILADDSYRKQYFYAEDQVFIQDSETLATSAETHDFDLVKIYLQRYAWNRVFDKPQAKADFISTLNKGTLYINFLGHANWNMFAHENLFRTPVDMAAVQNDERLPLFFGGTCEMALLDDPRLVSSGEYLQLHPQGGTIACIGSARWTMHLATFAVNEDFYRRLFCDSTRGTISIGQTLLEAKITAGFPDQTEVMFLLGNPAQCLAIPQYSIALTVLPDSISLIKRVIVKGEVQNTGKRISEFKGKCSMRLYDSAVDIPSLGFRYRWPGKMLYEGVAEVNKGLFETDFFVTEDTCAGGQLGRVVACAWQENSSSGSILHSVGSVDSLYVLTDSLSQEVDRDTIGAKVSVFMAGMEVLSGESHTGFTIPMLLEGRIVDQVSGIFQHPLSPYTMTLKVDGEPLTGFDPNQHFRFEDDSRTSGRFIYKIE